MTVIKTLKQLSKRFKEINKGSDNVAEAMPRTYVGEQSSPPHLERINKILNELGWKEKERFYCQGTEIMGKRPSVSYICRRASGSSPHNLL